MIYETRLDWINNRQTVHLDFIPNQLTIINPTPFPVYAESGSGSPPTGGARTYIITAGNSMTIPTRQREWGFKLVTSGTEPESMTPAIIFFSQDEGSPSVTAIGVATVSYRKTTNAIDIGEYTYVVDGAVSGSSWVALDDTKFALELEVPVGSALIGFQCSVIRNAGTGNLELGVYDSLDAEIKTLDHVGYTQTHVHRAARITFNTPGLRTLYIRARVSISDTRITIEPYGRRSPGAGTVNYTFYGIGF